MFKMRQILEISILDSAIKGNIYLGEYEKKIYSLCTVRSEQSPLFIKEEEHEAYHAAREWFTEQFDGFVHTEALGYTDSSPEVKEFRKIIGKELFGE